MCGMRFKSQKRTPKPQKNRTNSTKEFSKHFGGTSESNKGFEANGTRKFTRMIGKVLWGTLFCSEYETQPLTSEAFRARGSIDQ